VVAIILIAQMLGGPSNGAGTTPDTAGGTGSTQVAPTVRTVAPLSSDELSDDVCQIKVDNRLATIHEQPEVFAQEIFDVPPGVYTVEQVANVNFGGLQEQRWFLITVSGRQGWLQDSTFNIGEKSAACP
jgi:hypothetical protein